MTFAYSLDKMDTDYFVSIKISIGEVFSIKKQS